MAGLAGFKRQGQALKWRRRRPRPVKARPKRARPAGSGVLVSPLTANSSAEPPLVIAKVIESSVIA